MDPENQPSSKQESGTLFLFKQEGKKTLAKGSKVPSLTMTSMKLENQQSSVLESRQSLKNESEQKEMEQHSSSNQRSGTLKSTTLEQEEKKASKGSQVHSMTSMEDRQSSMLESHKSLTNESEQKEKEHQENLPAYSSKENEPTEHDVSEVICKEFANEFLDYAMDMCFERFIYEKGPQIIAWELRDTWLEVINMNWLDTEVSILEDPNSAAIVLKPPVDEEVLPPKADFWSQGALESLPSSCRESIMDPFLRDNIPWYLRHALTEPDLRTELEKAGLGPSTRSFVARPTSHIPTESNDDTWSTGTSAGESFANIKKIRDGSTKLQRTASPIPASAASMAKNKNKKAPKKSIEVLYPTKLHPIEIKASSEMSYNIHGVMPWKENASDVSEKGNELIAFKLPNQTSSESIRFHNDRKNMVKEQKSDKPAWKK